MFTLLKKTITHLRVVLLLVTFVAAGVLYTWISLPKVVNRLDEILVGTYSLIKTQGLYSREEIEKKYNNNKLQKYALTANSIMAKIRSSSSVDPEELILEKRYDEALGIYNQVLLRLTDVGKIDRLWQKKRLCFQKIINILLLKKDYEKAKQFTEKWIEFDDRDLHAQKKYIEILSNIPEFRELNVQKTKELYEKFPDYPNAFANFFKIWQQEHSPKDFPDLLKSYVEKRFTTDYQKWDINWQTFFSTEENAFFQDLNGKGELALKITIPFDGLQKLELYFPKKDYYLFDSQLTIPTLNIPLKCTPETINPNQSGHFISPDIFLTTSRGSSWSWEGIMLETNKKDQDVTPPQKNLKDMNWEVFWSESVNPKFSSKDRLKSPMTLDGAKSTTFIPVKKDILHLRLDFPSDRNLIYKQLSIQFKTSNNSKNINLSDIKSHMHNMKRFGENNFVILGDDPYFYVQIARQKEFIDSMKIESLIEVIPDDRQLITLYLRGIWLPVLPDNVTTYFIQNFDVITATKPIDPLITNYSRVLPLAMNSKIISK